MSRRLFAQPYTSKAEHEESVNFLDYISDIYSFCLSLECTKLEASVNKLKREKENLVSIDVGGDIGIQSELLSRKLKIDEPRVIDIRNRVNQLSTSVTSQIIDMILNKDQRVNQSINMYRHTWGECNIEEHLSQLDLELKKERKVEHDGYNFYGYSPMMPVDIIFSYSSIDYFRAGDFFAKATSLQAKGGLLYVWIPSAISHFNVTGIKTSKQLCALASMPMEKLVASYLCEGKDIEEMMTELINYQQGEGPMCIENYISKLQENDYKIISSSKKTTHKRRGELIEVSYYNDTVTTCMREVKDTIELIKNNYKNLGSIDIEDIFSPYYYILAEKI